MSKFNFLIIKSLLFLFCITSVFSQTGYERMGKDFWIGLPEIKRSSNEIVRWGQDPIQLWLSPIEDGVVTIEPSDGLMQKKIVNVKKNEIKVVTLSDFYEMKGSEVRKLSSYHITSTVQISLTVFTAYKWSGEAYNAIPTPFLGKDYYTLNLYQDKCKMSDGTIEAKPGNILIISTENGTEVTYTPAAETAAGIKAGEDSTISLREGDAFQIQAKIISDSTHSRITDLTGTHITSTKPIVVISGHTKVAFPKYPHVFLGSLKADFMRNCQIEMMPPVESLGKQYVIAPIKYQERYNYGTTLDDKGDIIRFVATEDGTILYTMREDGSSERQLTLAFNKGEWFEITNLDRHSYFRSNHKILVGHYGKAWWSTPVEADKDNDIQNPPRNGQGMMMTSIPVEKWYTKASGKSPEGIDNYIYLTFRTDDYSKLIMDGRKLTDTYGNSASTEIPGTDYSFLTGTISPGGHYIESLDNAKFAAYFYGNWDYAKDGFAYGYPAGDLDFSSILCLPEFVQVEVDTVIDDLADGNSDQIAKYELQYEDNMIKCIKIESLDLTDSSTNARLEIVSLLDFSTIFRVTAINPIRGMNAEVLIKLDDGDTIIHQFDFYDGTGIIPQKPRITSPEDKSSDVERDILIEWTDVLENGSYELQISLDSNFSIKQDYVIPFSNSFKNIYSLVYNTIYYCRVRATNEDSLSSLWSDVVSFTSQKDIPQAPIITYPSDGSKNMNVNIVIEWTDVLENGNYELQISLDSNISIKQDYVIPFSNPFKNLYSLVYNTMYYCRVRATNGDSLSSDWSDVVSFSTQKDGDNSIEAPEIIYPINGSSNMDIIVLIEWSDVMDDDGSYELQLSKQLGFEENTPFETHSKRPFMLVDSLDYSSFYYCRVRAANTESVYSPWSDVVSFATKNDLGINEEVVNHDEILVYPNPFKGSTEFKFNLNEYSYVSIRIFDLNGNELSTIANGYLTQGNYIMKYDGSGLSSGIYYYSVQLGEDFHYGNLLLY